MLMQSLGVVVDDIDDACTFCARTWYTNTYTKHKKEEKPSEHKHKTEDNKYNIKLMDAW